MRNLKIADVWVEILIRYRPNRSVEPVYCTDRFVSWKLRY